MPSFSTTFTPPVSVPGLELEVDIPESTMRLTWQASAIPQVDFGGYRIYRSLDGVTYDLLEVLTLTTDTEYEDFEAPLNVNTTYRVTQSNLDFESAPEEVSGTLESLMWWAVGRDNPSLTFPIPKVRSASAASPKSQDVFRPLGRPGAVAVGDVVQDESGEISFLTMPDNPGMWNLLKALQREMEGSMILKAPDGSIFHVQYADISRKWTNIPGMQEISLPFIGVS